MKLAKPPHFWMDVRHHLLRAFLPMCRWDKPAAAMDGLEWSWLS